MYFGEYLSIDIVGDNRPVILPIDIAIVKHKRVV